MQRDKVAFKLQASLAELGIEKAALHTFRHSAASELIEGGAHPRRPTSDAAQRCKNHAPTL